MKDAMAIPGSNEIMDTMLREQAEEWLLLLVSGRATAADAAEFRKWRDGSPAHAGAFAEVQRLWDALDPAIRMVTAGNRKPCARTAVMLPDRSVRRWRSSRRAFLGLAATAGAACVVATSPFGLWPDWHELGADYRTATGEQAQFVLNGVLVELNTKSAVKRGDDGGAGTSFSVLGGEVAISLDRTVSAPVSVFVEGFRIEMAGPAELNIRCEQGDARIACIRGHVDIHAPSGTRRVLSGQEVLVDAGSIRGEGAFDYEMRTAWRRQLLVFEGVRLSDVVHEVNRYWRGRIVLIDRVLSQRVVHMRMALPQLQRFPDLVRDAYSAKVTTMPGGVVFIG